MGNAEAPLLHTPRLAVCSFRRARKTYAVSVTTMAKLDLSFPGASPEQLNRGLAAAGDVVRASGFSLIELYTAHAAAVEGRLSPTSWQTAAEDIFRLAEIGAFAACSDQPAPPGAVLRIIPRSVQE